ncbi:MAG: hypothetical protein EA424_12615, partial [Planctomycetaceae bacterium]
KFDDFVQVLDAWWATRIETTDSQGRRTALVRQTFQPLSAEAIADRLADELAARDAVQLIREPLPSVARAKQAIADGKDDYSDRLAMVLHFAQSQQWTRVMEHLDAAEKMAVDRPGVRFVRDAILHVGRRHEEFKARIGAEAEELARLHADRAANDAPRDRLFLAEYLLGQASGVLEANEMLALLDALRPVYHDSPDHLQAMKRWMQQRVNHLRQTGRAAEAQELRRQLAEQYPRDYRVQQSYAQTLFSAGEHESGYAWLERVLASDVDWLPHEENSLRGAYAQQLRNEGRFPEMLEFLEDWIASNPENSDPYARYLSTLVRVDRQEDANRQIARWLDDGRRPDRIVPDAAARLQAALNQALGRGHELYTDRIEERWHQPLAETALFLAEHPTQAHVADLIMGHPRFRQTDACRRVRAESLQRLEEGIGDLPPPVVRRYVDWLMPDDPAVEAGQWRKLAVALRARWQAETDANHRNQLGQVLGRILADRLTVEEHLKFLLLQLASGPTDHAASHARQLFDALLTQPWQQEHEDEALALLDRLAEAAHPTDAAERLLQQVADLYRVTDAMLQARFEKDVAAIEEPRNLSRTELREQRRAAFQQAADGLAARLRKEMDAREGPFVQWLNIERIYLEMQRADSAVPVAGEPEQAEQRAEAFLRLADECWEMLGPKPPRLDIGQAPDLAEQLEVALKTRCLATLANLAARRSAEAALIERLLEYLDRGIAAEPETEAWKRLKYQLLVALDRPAELEAALHDWIRPEEAVNHWRLVLGYLLAEQGKILPAIAQFEAIRADDELGPAEYRALAGWYLAADRREQHERALVEVYMTAEEWELSNLLSRHLSPWQRSDGALPAELSAEVLRIFAALFDKSGSPQNHLRQVREFYRATRDFRLLRGMADAVIGHTAGKIYPFLQGMDTVLSEVREEATVDTIVEHLAAVRRRATTDVDRRALDLLEMMIERRAAELQNQPGPHGERALAALQCAMQRAWTPGEPRLVADLLVGLGTIAYPPLADEQIRQLQRLHHDAERGSADRLHVAHGLGRIYWGYDRRSDALALLDAALAEYEQANDGVLPALANDALGTLIGYLEQQGHYAAGERRLRQQLERPATRQQSYWLTQRLYQLYENAIRNGAALSIGAGQTLYQNVERTVRGDLETGNHNHRHQLISRLCGIYRAAGAKELSSVEDDLQDFAFEQLPRLLPRQTTHYQSIVSTVSDTLRHV